MNKLVLIICLLGISNTAFAETNKEKFCQSMLEYSKSIMLKKQNGTPIDEALRWSELATKDGPQALKDLGNVILRQAYELPSYSGADLKKKQYNDFIAYQYNFCMIHKK